MVAYQGGKHLIAKELTRVILDRTPPPRTYPVLGAFSRGRLYGCPGGPVL